MTPEEEAKMMNEDHEIWKKSKRIKNHNKDITKLKMMQFNNQLEELVMAFRATSNLNRNKYSVFAHSCPLFIDWEKRIPLCTTDEYLARHWLFCINQELLRQRTAVVNLINEKGNGSDLSSMFSARCIMLPIDPAEGDVDVQISGMYYFGLIISHYDSERKNNYDIATDCECYYNSGEYDEEA